MVHLEMCFGGRADALPKGIDVGMQGRDELRVA